MKTKQSFYDITPSKRVMDYWSQRSKYFLHPIEISFEYGPRIIDLKNVKIWQNKNQVKN